MSTYSVLDIEYEWATTTEQLGSKEKFWFTLPEGDLHLLKYGRESTGENWSERGSCELAKLLNLPCATYELAVCEGRRAVVTPSFYPKGARLVLGNEALAKVAPNYGDIEDYRERQHTVGLVMALLQSASPHMPIDYAPKPPINTAGDLFVGYLMLDAWIANTDRHHENWGFVSVPGGSIHLAPTFDHAACLGCYLADEERRRRLITRDKRYDIDFFVTRARSALFRVQTDAQPLSTLEAFVEAGRQCRAAALHWLDKLEQLSDADVTCVFSLFPDGWITDASTEFAIEVLRANKVRLLGLRERFG